MHIKIKDVSYVYDEGTPFFVNALKNINLDIEHGQIVSIIGHTGSGKSTLIQTINGILRPSSGYIKIGDYIIDNKKRDLSKLRQDVGLVFQYPEYQLFEETVYKDISFSLKKSKMSDEEKEERVNEAIQTFNLPKEILDKSPFELSGGQKRKVAICGILVTKPKVLILDEPTAGLDPMSKKELLELILDINKKYNTTIIFVTHSMDEVLKIADKLIVMNKGKVVLDGRPLDVFSHKKQLVDIDLDIPELLKLAIDLENKGFKISGDISVKGIKSDIVKNLRSGV